MKLNHAACVRTYGRLLSCTVSGLPRYGSGAGFWWLIWLYWQLFRSYFFGSARRCSHSLKTAVPYRAHALLLSLGDSHGLCNVTGYEEGRAAIPSWCRCLDFITALFEYGGMSRLREQDSLQEGNPVVGFRKPMHRESSATASDECAERARAVSSPCLNILA
jgi:hypothetical protein